MFKRMVWPLMLILSVGLVLLFMGGLVATLQITGAEEETSETLLPESPAQEMKDKTGYQLVLIGDSLATGIGDEIGQSLGERITALMEADVQAKEWEAVDLSEPGSKSGDWVIRLEEEAMRGALRTADLIVISIGGNDLKGIVQADALGGLVEYEETLSQYLSDLDQIMNALKGVNPTATVVVLGLYNPYGESIGETRIQLLLEWNYETQVQVAGSNCVLVPLYDLFQFNREDYLFLDQFHPNEEGYEAIARRIFEVVRRAGLEVGISQLRLKQKSR